jgi:hypothetical protein
MEKEEEEEEEEEEKKRKCLLCTHPLTNQNHCGVCSKPGECNKFRIWFTNAKRKDRSLPSSATPDHYHAFQTRPRKQSRLSGKYGAEVNPVSDKDETPLGVVNVKDDEDVQQGWHLLVAPEEEQVNILWWSRALTAAAARSSTDRPLACISCCTKYK